MKNTVKKYIDLFRQKNVSDGTIYEVEETGKFYVRNGHTWDEMKQAKIKEGTGPSMSLYELNQNSVINLPLLTKEQIFGYKEKIRDWYLDVSDYHFMLLSKNYNYYTLFAHKDNYPIDFEEMVLDTIAEFSKVYSINLDKENNGWEIWACLNDTDKVPEVFYLFPYEAGVIYYG